MKFLRILEHFSYAWLSKNLDFRVLKSIYFSTRETKTYVLKTYCIIYKNNSDPSKKVEGSLAANIDLPGFIYLKEDYPVMFLSQSMYKKMDNPPSFLVHKKDLQPHRVLWNLNHRLIVGCWVVLSTIFFFQSHSRSIRPLNIRVEIMVGLDTIQG